MQDMMEMQKCRGAEEVVNRSRCTTKEVQRSTRGAEVVQRCRSIEVQMKCRIGGEEVQRCRYDGDAEVHLQRW